MTGDKNDRAWEMFSPPPVLKHLIPWVEGESFDARDLQRIVQIIFKVHARFTAIIISINLYKIILYNFLFFLYVIQFVTLYWIYHVIYISA